MATDLITLSLGIVGGNSQLPGHCSIAFCLSGTSPFTSPASSRGPSDPRDLACTAVISHQTSYCHRERGRAIPLPSESNDLALTTAQRRKNVAHGVSRGGTQNLSPSGAAAGNGHCRLGSFTAQPLLPPPSLVPPGFCLWLWRGTWLGLPRAPGHGR